MIFTDPETLNIVLDINDSGILWQGTIKNIKLE